MAAFERFRADILAQWGIDVLTKGTLPSVAADIFRRHFMGKMPVRHRKYAFPGSRRVKGGWADVVRTQLFYNGPPEVRVAALRSYVGGRIDGFVRGLVEQPVEELDVVSLYPHAAMLQPLPNCDTCWKRVTTTDEIAVMEGFGMFSFKFPKDTQYPCLPVKDPRAKRLLFPLQGESSCTFAEVRAALALGGTIRVVDAWGFTAGVEERDHDVGRYMRHWLEAKASAERKTLGYETAKLFLNALIGKFAERHAKNSILDFERIGRASGHEGIGKIVNAAPVLRDALRGAEDVGALWVPEWASLILGRSRAIMAPIVATGALLVSTDSVIAPTVSLPAAVHLTELRSVGSDLRPEAKGDAVFISRSRLYAILQRADRIQPETRVIAADNLWAVVRVARQGSPETEREFADTVLRCLAARRDLAPERQKKRLLSAEGAVRSGGTINDEVVRAGKTHFRWDGKRRLDDRDVNVFTSYTTTSPYLTAGKLHAAERQELVRQGKARKQRRERAPELLDQVLCLLENDYGVCEVARLTGVPKSTVSDVNRTRRDARGVPAPGARGPVNVQLSDDGRATADRDVPDAKRRKSRSM